MQKKFNAFVNFNKIIFGWRQSLFVGWFIALFYQTESFGAF